MLVIDYQYTMFVPRFDLEHGLCVGSGPGTGRAWAWSDHPALQSHGNAVQTHRHFVAYLPTRHGVRYRRIQFTTYTVGCRSGSGVGNSEKSESQPETSSGSDRYLLTHPYPPLAMLAPAQGSPRNGPRRETTVPQRGERESSSDRDIRSYRTSRGEPLENPLARVNRTKFHPKSSSEAPHRP